MNTPQEIIRGVIALALIAAATFGSLIGEAQVAIYGAVAGYFLARAETGLPRK